MAAPHREKLHFSDTIRLFFSALTARRSLFILTLLLPIGSVLFTVAVPFYAGKVLAGIAHQDPNLNASLTLLGLCALAGIIANRIGFTRLMLAQAKAMTRLNRMVFDRLMERSVGFHADNISGKLVSDAVDFISAFGNLLTAIYVNGIPFFATLFIGLFVVLINSWQIGLFLSIVVFVTLCWAAFESRTRSSLRRRRHVESKKLTAHLADNIVNVQTVKTFGQELAESRRNNRLNQTVEALRIHDWQRAGRSGSNRAAALLVMQFCMILYVIHLTRLHPEMLATGIFAFTYTFTLFNRLFDLNNLTRIVEESFLQATPMTAMLNEPVEIKDYPNATDLTVPKGSIDIHDLSFGYDTKAKASSVFEKLNLRVARGEKIGLVGPSGGGKSTLTRLLLRFDDLHSGSIQVDGQDIAKVTQHSLRQSIAYVPQEPLLFHRTVRENIAYGKPDATDAEIFGAAKKANAHDFIKALANGYQTVVGERGVKLSGGQRQRVAIARAILKNAPILVLDEATSALDSESEVLIQGALWELMKDRTALVIAHRLSTIQRLDRIIVLDEGKIVEEGSHKELLAQNGLYARLWAHQSGGFLEEQKS